MSDLQVFPAPSLKVANEIVEMLHRHHRPIQTHKFSLVAVKDGIYVGCLIAQRPASPQTNQKHVIEVARLATNGTKNACSILYSAAARTAKAMGYSSIQTFILESETGASLRASNWKFVRGSGGGTWDRPKCGRRRADKHPLGKKYVYELTFKPIPDEIFELPWDDQLL